MNESVHHSMLNIDTTDNDSTSKSVNHFSVSTSIVNLNSNAVVSQAAQAISALGSSGPMNSKSYFDLKLKLVSTLHTQDVYLERFISLINIRNNLIDAHQLQSQEVTLRQALNDLCYVEAETLVKFLFVILDKILILFISSSTSVLAQCCIEVIAKIVSKVTHLLPNQNDNHKRNRLLVQYIKYSCNIPYGKNGRLFHEYLLNEWLSCLNRKSTSNSTASSLSSNIARDLLLKNAWFFIELLLKSLASYLNLKTNCLRPSSSGKKCPPPSNLSLNLFCTKQLNQKFLFDLNSLFKTCVLEVVSQLNVNETSLACGLNCAMAFFVYDAISFLDRGFLFKQIDFYFRETNRGLTNFSNQIKNVSL